MPATESIYQNQILFTVPIGFKDLSVRKLELDRITDGDPETMQALYLALADEFDAIDYLLIADKCRKRSDQWRLMR